MKSKAFVIGHPIDHSKSPLIHNFWLNQYNIPGSYRALDISTKELSAFINSLRLDAFNGGNITLPHKTAVAKLCDDLTITAKRVGAVNTIYRHANRIIGDNTDGYGFIANLDQQAPGWDSNLKCAIILGAGGATRAVIDALQQRSISQIIILNRTRAKAQLLQDEFCKKNKATQIITDELHNFDRYSQKTDIVVNTSSVGLKGTGFSQFDLQSLPAKTLVTDIVYTPLQTPLLSSAQDHGLQTVDGLGMLLHQAAPGFKKWFGVFPEVTKELRDLVLKQ